MTKGKNRTTKGKLASLLLTIVLIAFDANATQTFLPIQKQSQTCGSWCWAASVTAILNRYNIDYPEWPTDSETEECGYLGQCAVVNKWLGREDCCPADCWDTECNVGFPVGDISLFEDLFAQWGIDSGSFEDDLTEVGIEILIEEGKPFLIWWEWNAENGHIILGIGYDDAVSPREMVIMDPSVRAEDGGQRIATTDWVRRGYSEGVGLYHTWTGTVIMADEPSSSTVRLRCAWQHNGYIYKSSGNIVAGETAGEKYYIVGETTDTDSDTYAEPIQSNVDFRCGSNSTIYLKPGFKVENGEEFNARPE